MNLRDIYQPITDELKMVEDFVTSSIKESRNQSILAMSNFLLESSGKRIRPALVILSEKAASSGNKTCNRDELIKIASALELIHMASLIHDDVLDDATMRHSKPSINTKWGDDVSIALGDYIYSKAFELIGKCKNPDVFACISEAIYVMCEGELIQVCQRDNLDLSKDSYIVIVKKKSASLFAACCHAGTIIGNHSRAVQAALKEFGLNFGIAFQIIDDCKDIICEEKELGKHPGQDVIAGDVTLPLLTLLDVISEAEREKLKNIFESRIKNTELKRIRAILIDSNALFKTQEVVASYINRAKERLNILSDSDYKESLIRLVDYIGEETFPNFVR
ncbi:MAG: polyprenyl synthetase family protein [Planctomycetota bacterium]|jgi:geranylgeranyl pyrophosphate synthase